MTQNKAREYLEAYGGDARVWILAALEAEVGGSQAQSPPRQLSGALSQSRNVNCKTGDVVQQSVVELLV